MKIEKQDVHDFWNEASCGESLYLLDSDQAGYTAHATSMYALKQYTLNFLGSRKR